MFYCDISIENVNLPGAINKDGRALHVYSRDGNTLPYIEVCAYTCTAMMPQACVRTTDK